MNEINNRLNEILESSIIIDTLSHGPLLWSDDIIKANDEMLAQDMNPWDIIPILIMKFARNVVNDDEYYSKYVEAWKESGVNCISWTLGPMYSKPYSFDGVFHNFSYMTYMLENRPDLFIKVLKGADIERAYKEGKKGIILNVQSMEHIGKDINMVELNYMVGFRIMQLTYNKKIAVGTGCIAIRDRGLTEFGIEVVHKINELGAIVDISHCGPQTSMDALENSKDPIIASHTSAKSVYEHKRGKDDDFLKALAEKGGYIGVCAVSGFLTSSGTSTLENWLDHVDYIVNLVGIDYVGIGSDFYGFSVPDNLAIKIGEFIDALGFRPEEKNIFLTKVEGFDQYKKFPNLIKGLISRGYSNQEIKKLAGENFLRLFKKVVG